MARNRDIVALASDASEEDQSMEDWDYDDQVLDLDEKTLQSLKHSIKDDQDLNSDDGDDGDSDDEEEWGAKKNIYYDADQDDGKFDNDLSLDAEEEEKEEALLIQKKMLSKIQESDFEDDFPDSFQRMQSKSPKKEKAQVTVDIEKVLKQLHSTFDKLNDDQSFSNQLNWIYATILNYYIFLRRKNSLKYHPISKLVMKIQKLVPSMISYQDFLESSKLESVQDDIEVDKQDSEMDSDYYTEILNRNKTLRKDREESILQGKEEKRLANWYILTIVLIILGRLKTAI